MATENQFIHRKSDAKMLPSVRMSLLLKRGVTFNIVDGQLEPTFSERTRYRKASQDRIRHLIKEKNKEHIKALHFLNEQKHVVKGEDFRVLRALPSKKKKDKDTVLKFFAKMSGEQADEMAEKLVEVAMKKNDVNALKTALNYRSASAVLRLPKRLDTAEQVSKFQIKIIGYVAKGVIQSSRGTDLIRMAKEAYETIKDSVVEARIKGLEEEEKDQIDVYH